MVLWAEDNREDQLLVQAALEDDPDAPEVRFVDDGVLLLEALDEAASKGRKAAPAMPELVVLDLKMPRLGGLDALRRLRADPALAGLPVAVFSAGDHPGETEECRALGTLAVVRKPVDFREFTAAVRRLAALALPAKGPPAS